MMQERAFLFPCEDEELVGVISEPVAPVGGLGVLIIVGGPQYRVGSHRQFVLLARHLADSGVPCMRFDYRGMGDSTGKQGDFEGIDSDIRAAIDAFLERAPSVNRVVLWGLCDGASAACFVAPRDSRVAGLVLLNPWVKTAQGEARTYLRHYYFRRLFDASFWKKLVSGRISVGRSVGGVISAARVATGADAPTSQSLPDRMGAALRTAGKPVLLILSGRDYVAREFEGVATGDLWQDLLKTMSVCRIEAADHTFSSRPWRDEVAHLTSAWIHALA